jgi:glycyl-tRNA synthetase beta subunit
MTTRRLRGPRRAGRGSAADRHLEKRGARPAGFGLDRVSSDLAVLADLVEWPGAVRGSFDPQFLSCRKVTTTAMRTHQYLPVRGSSDLLHSWR